MGLAWSISHQQGRRAALLVCCSRWHRHWPRCVLGQPLDISKAFLGSHPDSDLEHIYRSRPVWFMPWVRRPDARHTESNRVGGGRPKHERVFVGFVVRSSLLGTVPLGIGESCTCPPFYENGSRTRRCTEWPPRDAGRQFGSHRGAAIGELNRSPAV